MLAPLPLFLAGSLSADSLTIGFTFLFTAATLRAHFSGLTHSTVGLLALSAIGTALCKWSYFPVVILMFGLPRGQSVKPAWRTRTVFVPVVIAALVVLVSVVWARLADPSHVMLRNTDPLGQVHWITAHPLEYVHVLTRTALEDGGNIFVSTLWTLGWLDVHLSHLFILAYTLVIGWTVVNDPEAMRLKIQFRLLAAAAVTIAALLIATCVFVAWDGFGQHIIEGIQGRYFIPLMLCGFVCVRRSSQRPLPTAALQGIVFFSGLLHGRRADLSVLLAIILNWDLISSSSVPGPQQHCSQQCQQRRADYQRRHGLMRSNVGAKQHFKGFLLDFRPP